MSEDQNKKSSLVLSNSDAIISEFTRHCIMIPSNIFCIKDNIILQLWRDQYSSKREWRPLKSFEEASKEFNCNIVVGE